MRCAAIAVVVSACALGVAVIIAAGPLNPPAGSVGSTYKTLGEIEPRIPINAQTCPSGPTFTHGISQPGSYYLTGNLTGESGKFVIRVAAENVSIDLNGFAITGGAGSTSGIDGNVLDVNNLTVKNGTISDCGGYGIIADVTASGWRIEGVRVVNCSVGISAGRNAIVQDCEVHFCTGTGIAAIWGSNIVNCIADSNGVGISGYFGTTVSGCSAQSNSGNGFSLGDGSTATACSAHSNGDCGFYAYDGSTVRGSTATDNTNDGIKLGNRAVAQDSSCAENGPAVAQSGAGIRAVGERCRIEGNALTGNYYAVKTDSTGAFVARNTASGNAFLLQYAIGGTNTWGPIVGGSGAISSTSPWANFTH